MIVSKDLIYYNSRSSVYFQRPQGYNNQNSTFKRSQCLLQIYLVFFPFLHNEIISIFPPTIQTNPDLPR